MYRLIASNIMVFKNKVYNGMYSDFNKEVQYCNAHLFYRGRSIIIDYEWILHVYSDVDKKKAANLVPFEIYPYNTDIYVGYVKLGGRFEKVDLSDLISKLDEAIKKELGCTNE